MKKIILNKGKEHSLKRFHPWVFSGAISERSDKVADGDVAEVFSASGEYLGTGYCSHGSIAVRILSFEQTEINLDFWKRKIADAYQLRQQIGLSESTTTTVFRLLNAEGDGIPGLIIDFYNGTAVVQAHSFFVHDNLALIAEALQSVLGDKLKAVYDKSEETLHAAPVIASEAKQLSEAISLPVRQKSLYVYGKNETNEVLENGNRFYVNWEEGQKTGFFIDQRENRKLLGYYSKGKRVLNTFCYSGGFSVYALKAGASWVVSVDASRKAIEWTDQNVLLNGFDDKMHHSHVGDVQEYMKTAADNFDIIILDPPAFAKHQKAKHNAVQGYRRLNESAIRKIKSGGLIFTFSCSQAVDRPLFESTVMAAAIDAGRRVRILHHLSQPADHPVSVFHPEGQYLKGLVVQVG
ncbi:MAG: Ribosomal RNA large subunit methyltransferase I [Bacteroidia bacterium]|nr:Ribosomal RNA large subunit methyltransferase I [Bacteroidia bacterium]